MKTCIRTLALFFAAAWTAAAYGQIEVPAESEANTPIVATITTAVPTGATFDGQWESSAAFLPAGDNSIHLWAAPGTHSLSYSGFWVQVEPITFKDGDGNTITVQSYLGSGRVNETAEFSVAGGAEPDNPQPPGPVPTGPKHLVFFVLAEELDTMPPTQKYLVNSLTVRKDLTARGHTLLLVMDDDQLRMTSPGKWAPWINAVAGDQLPRVGIAPAAGGEVEDHELPIDYLSLLKLLGESP